MFQPRTRRLIVLVALLPASVSCRGAQPVREPAAAAPGEARAPVTSVELQAKARSEERRFAQAVAAEPPSARVAVEAVSPEVLVDRGAKVVYVLGPDLVALELETGLERWRVPETPGSALGRLGRWLLVWSGAAPSRPRLVLLQPASPGDALTCELSLPAPAEAEFVSLLAFERGAETLLWWKSGARQRPSGVRPSEEQLRRVEAAEACGIVALDVARCATTPRPIGEFLMSPPRDMGAVVETAADDCRYLVPGRSLPAVAASLIPAASAEAGPPWLGIATSEVPDTGGGCIKTIKSRLDASDAGGAIRWSHPLPDRVNTADCPPPPASTQKPVR